MSKQVDNAALRAAIGSSIPAQTAQFGSDLIEHRYLYLPLTHRQALDPDNMLVVGIRGAGKSLWWKAMQSGVHRATLSVALEKVGIGAKTTVTAGFGEASSEHYPTRDILGSLVGTYKPRHMWLAVVVWQVCAGLPDLPTWKQRVDWVTRSPEAVARKMREANERLASTGEKHLILFDALDRTADAWDEIVPLVKGLLELLLELRASPRVRAKAFLRPDMIDAPEVAAFPDASKVISSRVELRWPRVELYGLLWQYLGNAEQGAEEFRRLAEVVAGDRGQIASGVWRPPSILRKDESLQRQLFDKIAGNWMGRDHRRGFPYTWLPNHLADAHEQTSPRSFLAAIRAAAEDQRYGGHRFALHYEAIKRGVQTASGIRVAEVGEDFPWIRDAMEPLKDLVIPCEPQRVFSLWKEDEVLGRIRKSGTRQPRQMERGLVGLLEELQTIGLFVALKDARLNIPDVYRIGFGVRRKGGVKPVD